MGFELDIFGDEQLEADYIEWLVDEQSVSMFEGTLRSCGNITQTRGWK